jgi:hypothetical protein
MTKITDIIRKIRALRARAADSASSEAEAAKAAAVADKLLREHNIDLSELDVRAEGVEKNVWGVGKRTRGPETFAANRIGKATNCEVWIQNGGEIVYLGNPADVEVALYYTDLVSNAAEACLRQFRKTEDCINQSRYFSARKVSSDYRLGVCSRLGERILDQVRVERAPVSSGADLVVVKNALIQQWLEDNGLAFKRANRSRRVGASYGAGREAAENVGIGRGVGTQRTTQRAIR